MLKVEMDKDIFYSLRLRLARNIQGFPFVWKATFEQLREIKGEVTKAITSLKSFPDLWILDMEELPLLERKILAERRLISYEFALLSHPRLLITDPEEKLGIMVNEEDHLRIQVFGNSPEGRPLLEKLKMLDRELEEYLPFSATRRWGYLNACPTNAGTGLRASLMMHLPSLVIGEKIKEVAPELYKKGWEIRGYLGEGSHFQGNLFQISNRFSLGYTEEEIVDNLMRLYQYLRRIELERRGWLLKEGKVELEDSLMRSMAILKAARKISTGEALHHLSILWLGSIFGIIEGVEDRLIKRLQLMIQPAHLQKRFGEELSPLEREIIRANLLREILFNQEKVRLVKWI